MNQEENRPKIETVITTVPNEEEIVKNIKDKMEALKEGKDQSWSFQQDRWILKGLTGIGQILRQRLEMPHPMSRRGIDEVYGELVLLKLQLEKLLVKGS